jgi:hypothetical protein
MANEQQIPRLVLFDLYRNALKSVEKISRSRKDRKLHAWVMKAIDETNDIMVQIATDEMYGEEVESGEEKQQKVSDEEFYG